MNSNDDVAASVLLFITMLLWGTTSFLEKIGLNEVELLTGVGMLIGRGAAIKRNV